VTVPGRLVAFGASVVMRLIDKHNRNAITNNSIILTRKKSWFSTDIVETPCKPPAAMKKSAAISSVAVAHAVEQQPCLINRKGLWLIEPSSDRNLNRKKGRRRYERIVFASDGSVEVIFKAAGWRTISGWTDVRDGVWHPIAGYKKVRNASVFRLEKI
jgi:hypothetical protein